MKAYDGDVLETALTSGRRFSAQKHKVTVEHVNKLVSMFSDETADKCHCLEELRKTGMKWMCMACTGGQNNRIIR